MTESDLDPRQRPRQVSKKVHNFLKTVRPLSCIACGHGTEMLLILKKYIFDLISSRYIEYHSPKKCLMILYAVNLWLKPVSATGAITKSSQTVETGGVF